MPDVHSLAIDLAKRSFQVCATDRGGAVLFNRTVSRAKLRQLLSAQSPCIVAMEACATSHYWGRFAQGAGGSRRHHPAVAKWSDGGAGEQAKNGEAPFVRPGKNRSARSQAHRSGVNMPSIIENGSDPKLHAGSHGRAGDAR